MKSRHRREQVTQHTGIHDFTKIWKYTHIFAILTSSVSLLRVSCRTCECVMSHLILRICVLYADLIGLTCACIVSHMWMSHVTYMWMSHVTSHTCDNDFYEYMRVVLILSFRIIHASCRTCEWYHVNASCLTWLKHRVNNIGHVWMSHVKCEWVTSHICMYRVVHVNECECVMSHVNESCHTWMKHRVNDLCHMWISHVVYECDISRVNASCHMRIHRDESCQMWMKRKMNEACHVSMNRLTCTWVMSRVDASCHMSMRRVSNPHVSHRTSESITSFKWISYATHMYRVA